MTKQPKEKQRYGGASGLTDKERRERRRAVKLGQILSSPATKVGLPAIGLAALIGADVTGTIDVIPGDLESSLNLASHYSSNMGDEVSLNYGAFGESMTGYGNTAFSNSYLN